MFAGSLESGVLELVTTTGTDIIDFSGSSTGNVYINFGSALDVLTAEFCALDPTGQLFTQSYSVAGFTSVPDGGMTLTLLGIGLLSLVIFRRKLAF
jgi:VPDSG-CTERM motif